MTKVTVAIGSRSEAFILVQTDAPAVYDHGAAIQLHDASFDGRIERYVLVPESALEWQRGRNASGLRSLVTEGLLVDERDVTAKLWKRLYAEQTPVTP